MPPKAKKKAAARSSGPATEVASGKPIVDYRFDATRKNLPPAGLAAQGKLEQAPRIRYSYDPHRPPVLRFDGNGVADRLTELLAEATRRTLTDEEARTLREALAQREPWLEWAGKRETHAFTVEPVALHLHERISTQAILKVAARKDATRDLFADPEMSYREAVQFYKYDIDWANRMILGDSLQVMASLARREDLAGKVQMIYLDPPYGIKFASNFQPEVGKRDVKDKESDLTREPEMVKAYRDTWTLGVHSYLAYLRDRLIVARELLADTGSIFVQISDENLHRVRNVLDEAFGSTNALGVIAFQKTTGASGDFLSSTCDFLLWYAKNCERTKYSQLYYFKEPGQEGGKGYSRVELQSGQVVAHDDDESSPPSERILTLDNITSQRPAQGADVGDYDFRGARCTPGKGTFKTDRVGLERLESAGRLALLGRTLRYVRYLDDFSVAPLANLWSDTTIAGFAADKIYVVQTNAKIIERCMLMTTDPGDLVLDPTCGSGTTAFVAEQWGRRWITCDTSRVALALARQRLLTAKYDYYGLRPVSESDLARNETGPWLADPTGQIKGHATLDCEMVPHVTLRSIAQNTGLDPIFAKHAPILDAKLAALNKALDKAPAKLRTDLRARLAAKQKAEGKRAVTDADRRRWLLPPENRAKDAYTTVANDFAGWYEWEVPFDADPDWPKALSDALTEYRAAWRAKMDEVNGAIAASAESEELVDRPRVVRNVVRVSGPFTMESVMPAEATMADRAGGNAAGARGGSGGSESPIDGPGEPLDTFDAGAEPANAEAFLDRMLRLLAADGVRFPNNRSMRFDRLSPIGEEFLHAEGEWVNGDGRPQSVAVSVGPEFGPVTAWQVENALAYASRRGFENLVFAGFSFDGAAQAVIQEDPNPRVRCHLAHIRPDVNMGGLLKETPGSQLFTVFGLPRSKLIDDKDGQHRVRLEGVDIYDPVENTIRATDVDKVAAWFVDADYDGRTFCITQAFFPDKSAWDKLARALKGVVDEDAFTRLSGTESLPFPAGPHKRVAIKVIDPRGNEVMRVHRLDRTASYA